MTKTVFTASLLGTQQERNNVEKNAATLLVVFLGETINEIPASLCGRPLVWLNSLPGAVAMSDITD